MKYKVMLELGVWLAPWDGDPGRTMMSEFATVFDSKIEAITALKSTWKYRPFKHAQLVKVRK